jgi:RND family efflux transporter MFP subunit
MSRTKLIVAGAVIVIVSGFGWRWIGHTQTRAEDPESATADAAAPIAAVVRAQRGDLNSTLAIAGEFKPFQEVDVHAKVAGYIHTIYVDVGDHVKAGQELAVLEIPELAAQLSGAQAGVRRSKEEIRTAKAEVQQAESAQTAAHSQYVRLKQAADARAGLVAQQEVDDAQAKDLGSQAQVARTQANLSAAEQQLDVAQATLKQYTALSDYSTIRAPFSGVITVRYADTGALIAAGTNSSTQSMPVVRLAETSKLRLVLPVPESVAAQIHLGETVKVRVQALNRTFEGKVSRFADALNVQTRTMETEIDFENHDGHLMPGMYGQAVLALAGKTNVLTIPLDGVSRDGNDATVLMVNAQGVIEERHVKLGAESNSEAEVVSGLSEGDRIVIGNRSEFHAGERVHTKAMAENTQSMEGGN